MSESAMTVDQREEAAAEEEVEMWEEGENGESIESNGNTGGGTNTSQFLKELNLVLILSFLSLSAEERLDFEEIKPKDVATKHPKPKLSASAVQVCKRESKVNEFRALERQTHKFQTKIRDCRHCRRM